MVSNRFKRLPETAGYFPSHPAAAAGHPAYEKLHPPLPGRGHMSKNGCIHGWMRISRQNSEGRRFCRIKELQNEHAKTTMLYAGGPSIFLRG